MLVYPGKELIFILLFGNDLPEQGSNDLFKVPFQDPFLLAVKTENNQ